MEAMKYGYGQGTQVRSDMTRIWARDKLYKIGCWNMAI